MRVAVYSPAKNEEHNVDAWAESAQDADEIVLVDTGSSDATLDRAQKNPRIQVSSIIVSPWRFDDGFNVALSHVRADIDIAVPLHLDERLQSGWRSELEVAWEKGGRQFTFDYEYASGLTYRHDRIHARHGYRWKYPAHETPVGPGPRADTGLTIIQVEEPGNRSRSDSSLIHLMLAENPDDPRAQYYSAREHLYANDWDKARTGFLTYLANSQAVYDQERSEACRHMATMVFPQYKEAWLLKACAEAPQRREVWADLAMHYWTHDQADFAIGPAYRVLSITERTQQNSFHLESWAWDDETFKKMVST